MRQIRPSFAQPSAALSPFVRNYWWVPAAEHSRSGTLQADGNVGFHLAVDPTIRERSGRHTLRWDPNEANANQIVLAPHRSLLGVRFHPGGFYRLFGVSVSFPLIGPECLPAAELECVLRCSIDREDPEAACGELDVLLSRRLNTSTSLHPILGSALTTILQQRGKVDVATLVRRSHASRRHFERVFRQQVGSPPALFARLQRVNAAREQLKAGASSLAHVAQECGFFDQAHLNREFRRSLGDSPRRYRDRKRTG